MYERMCLSWLLSGLLQQRDVQIRFSRIQPTEFSDLPIPLGWKLCPAGQKPRLDYALEHWVIHEHLFTTFQSSWQIFNLSKCKLK